VTLNANIQNTNSFTWTNGSTSPSITIYDSIILYAIASDTINNCASDTSSTFTIIKNNYANINAGNDTSICLNAGPLTIGSLAESGVSYSWSSVPSGFVSNNSLESVNPSLSTLYIIEANNNGCINRDSIQINVVSNLNTNISITSSNTVICANDNIQFNTSVNGGGNNPIYQWYINNNPIPFSNTSSYSNNNFSDGDTIYCVLTTSLSCATNPTDTSNYIIIAVTNKPNINIINNGDTTICQGQNVTLIASNLQNIDNFSWSTTDVNDTILVNTPQNIFLYAYNTCGSDTDNILVTVNPLPNALISASGPTTFCSGGSVNLNYSTASNTSYSWSNGSINNSINVNTSGWIYLLATNSCGTDKDSILITVNNGVNAIISATKSLICNNDSILLTSSSLSNNLWSTGETSNSIWVYSGGIYGLTINSITCGNPNTSIVINQEIVNAEFTIDKDTGYVPLEINTNNLSTGATVYNWNFGNGINQSTTNASVIYSNSGEYTITLTATGVSGCIDTAIKFIRASDPPVGLEFPNIFTPNNDNQNDTFKPTKSIGITEGLLEIYNRWGLLILEIKDTTFIWNGKINEEPAADGVYYYIAKAKTISPNKPELEVKGYFTLTK
jgi:gliding motility-associated-like protein